MGERFSIERDGIIGRAILTRGRGIREAIYTGFFTGGGDFTDTGLAIRLIREGAALLRQAGAQYICGSTRNPAIAYCFLSVQEGLVAYRGTEPVADTGALGLEMWQRMDGTTILNRIDGQDCVGSIPAGSNLDSEIWAAWPLNGPVVPHVHYMVLGNDGEVLHIQAEKPTGGNHIATMKYLPGDERYHAISLNEAGSIQFVRRDVWG